MADLVIADTSPINYLILIHRIGVLPELFGRIVVPQSVRNELTDPDAPPSVRTWISSPPLWLEVYPDPAGRHDAQLDELDPGERAAIAIA